MREKKEPFGFTIVEILIAVSLVALLSVGALLAGRFITQIQKAHDAKRKADLSRLQKILEDYYGDKGHYPETLDCGSDVLSPYLNSVPCDPSTKTGYKYVVDPDAGQWYIIFAKLEYESDPIIQKRACRNGCQVEGEETVYNYLVTSPNVSTSVVASFVSSPSPTPSFAPTPTPTPTPTLSCPEGLTPRALGPLDCQNPSAYCPPQGGEGCCVSGTLYCEDNTYWCCVE